jgi:hypothetical protein
LPVVPEVCSKLESANVVPYDQMFMNYDSNPRGTISLREIAPAADFEAFKSFASFTDNLNDPDSI